MEQNRETRNEPRIERPEMNYVQLIYDQRGKNIQWGKGKPIQ